MSDISGVAADSTPAPAEVVTPNPVSTEPEGHVEPEVKPEPKPEKVEKTESKPISTREALEKAAAKVEKAEEAKAKPEAKPEVKTEAKKPEAKDAKDAKPEAKTEAKDKPDVKRGEHGHFAPKEDKPVAPKDAEGLSSAAEEAPKWIKPHEKAAWSTMAPEQRAIAERRNREAAEGIEKHRPAIERDATLNEFHEMAKQSGKDLRTVVSEYVNMEQTLRKDLVGGLDTICQHLGVSLRDVAAHVMGQKPEQVSSQQDATIRELRGQIEQLTKQVGSVSQTFQQQQETAVGKEVTAFAADHPRFGELADDIAFFLKTRCPGDLKQAYELAERLNPAPAKTEPSKAPVIDLSVQTEKGSKSINGAPSAGSSPARQQPSNSIRDALKKAVAAAG